MTMGEEMWEIVCSEKSLQKGLDIAGLQGLHYFIKYYLARGKRKQYDAWLDYLRNDRKLPQEIQNAALRLFYEDVVSKW